MDHIAGRLNEIARNIEDELRAIKRYLATRTAKLPWLFVSERGQPMTRQAVNYLIRVAWESAGLKNVHPHMLRHSCGYYLANTGVDLRTMQDYLGPSRSETHRALHARGRPAVRRTVEVKRGILPRTLFGMRGKELRKVD
jgi:integrase